MRTVLFVAGGAITGAIGWSGHPFTFAVGVALPALWAFASSRRVAALVALAHFLGASRGLPVGASTFFGSQLAFGLGLWLAASLTFVAVHAALWTSRGGWRPPVRYAVAAILMSIPPFGIVGWAHPITAAGVLFGGWGWWGLAATAALLVAMTTRLWPIAACVAVLAFAWTASNWTPPTEPEGWRGINTRFTFKASGQYAEFHQQAATIEQVETAVQDGVRVAILPESAMGFWGSTTEHLWIRERSRLDVEIISGAAVVNPVGYDNVMIGVSGSEAGIVYRERMPVPISMWQPWTTGGAHAHFFANPVFEFGGLKVAPLICYEQLIIWPVVQSMMYAPDVIVATGNGWWTGHTSIVAIQRSSVEAWASLFGLPLVLAFNEPVAD